MIIRANISIDINELTDSIQDHEEAATVIKDVDYAMADYEFTERMAKYFIQELINECKFSGEEFDIKELTK